MQVASCQQGQIAIPRANGRGRIRQSLQVYVAFIRVQRHVPRLAPDLDIRLIADCTVIDFHPCRCLQRKLIRIDLRIATGRDRATGTVQAHGADGLAIRPFGRTDIAGQDHIALTGHTDIAVAAIQEAHLDILISLQRIGAAGRMACRLRPIIISFTITEELAFPTRVFLVDYSIAVQRLTVSVYGRSDVEIIAERGLADDYPSVQRIPAGFRGCVDLGLAGLYLITGSKIFGFAILDQTPADEFLGISVRDHLSIARSAAAPLDRHSFFRRVAAGAAGRLRCPDIRSPLSFLQRSDRSRYLAAIRGIFCQLVGLRILDADQAFEVVVGDGIDYQSAIDGTGIDTDFRRTVHCQQTAFPRTGHRSCDVDLPAIGFDGFRQQLAGLRIVIDLHIIIPHLRRRIVDRFTFTDAVFSVGHDLLIGQGLIAPRSIQILDFGLGRSIQYHLIVLIAALDQAVKIDIAPRDIDVVLRLHPLRFIEFRSRDGRSLRFIEYIELQQIGLILLEVAALGQPADILILFCL